jgi:hypothetical protein
MDHSSKWRGIMWYPSFGLMCMCPPIPLSAPMFSRYNLRTDFKFCTVVWYQYARITNTRFVNPLFENSAYIKKNHIFSLLFNKIMFIFSYPSIFATCYPFPEIFTSFPFPPNRANSPFYPSVRSSSPTYLNQLSDHTEIRTWSAFYGTKQQYKIWNPFSSYIWKPLGRIEGWADTYTSIWS